MHIMKMIFFHALPKQGAFLVLCMLGCLQVVAKPYERPHVVCQRLRTATTLDAFCVALTRVVADLKALPATMTGTKSQQYEALMDEYAQYHLFLSCVMVNPKTGSIVYTSAPVIRISGYNLAPELAPLKQDGYVSFIRWAREQKLDSFNQFYISFVDMAAYLFSSVIHDLPVARPSDRPALCAQAKKYRMMVRNYFFYVQDTPYGKQYAHLPADYKTLFDEAMVLVSVP